MDRSEIKESWEPHSLFTGVIFFSAVVTSFVGSGESGFRDDTGTKATFANPQQLEIDSMKRRLFLSDTVSLHPMHLTLTPPV